VSHVPLAFSCRYFWTSLDTRCLQSNWLRDFAALTNAFALACTDAENCDLANSQTSYFPALKLHYSYAACASVNTFSSDATLAEDSGEGARKKLKEVIATTLIEDITGMPTHDTDMQLLSTLGEVDTWDLDELRKGMYVQGKHLLHNAEKGGYGKEVSPAARTPQRLSRGLARAISLRHDASTGLLQTRSAACTLLIRGPSTTAPHLRLVLHGVS
jgi:hypothetical protein